MNDTFEPSLLSGYLDNELTAAEVAVVEQALASDAQLQHELEEMRKLRAAIAALPMPPAQADMVAEVRRRIEQQQALRSGDSSDATGATLKLMVSFALAASLLVAVGWAVLQQRQHAVPVAIDRLGETTGTVPPQDPRPPIEQPAAPRQNGLPDSTPADMAQRRAGQAGSHRVQERSATAQPQARAMSRDAGRQPAAGSAVELAPNAPTPAATPAPTPAAEPSERMNMRRSLPAADAPAASESDAAMRSAPRSRGASSFAMPPAEIAVEGALQLRYLDRPAVELRQPSGSQLKRADSTEAGDRLKAANRTEAGESVKASDGAEPASLPVLVSSLRPNQLAPAHAWLRQQVGSADDPASDADPAVAADPAAEAGFDADRQLILIAGAAPAVAQLRERWSRYVQQNQGRLEVGSTPLTPAIAAELPESAAAAGSPLLIQLQLRDSE